MICPVTLRRIVVALGILIFVNAKPKLEHRLCNPGGLNVFPYSGFRFYRRYAYGWPTLHHWQIVHCASGEVDFSYYILANRTSTFPWATPLCIAPDTCLQAARSKKYSRRKQHFMVHSVMIGGLFRCTNTNCSINPLPLLPLLADAISSAFTLNDKKLLRRVRYVPYMYTPDFMSISYPRTLPVSGIPSWTKDVNVAEDYEFKSETERATWGTTDMLLDYVDQVGDLDHKYLPWEFDPVIYELQRERWRDEIRKTIHRLFASSLPQHFNETSHLSE